MYRGELFVVDASKTFQQMTKWTTIVVIGALKDKSKVIALCLYSLLFSPLKFSLTYHSETCLKQPF